ncbi:Smr/MutS family protein [Neptunomonas marina]|uniref:DNA mismatch repair protein MutS n=1 Tax=Neptunomonas marina TaxID=1815562 RepID=A0A437Q8M2_9GAMM|nr:Smr/MutS family protein [Neptunomonas marina]RVU30934.1 DNA mismatch repair protein MutS [Neptunomonas marina]
MSDTKNSPDESTPNFSDLMADVKPLNHDRVTRSNGPIRKNRSKALHRDAASEEIEQVIDGLSSEAVEIVESEEELLFAAPGVQIRVMKRLRKGHIPWEAGIDLHGMTIDTARDELSHFIRDAQRNSCRAVLVVHGKAFSQSGQKPILKSYVNDWLRQLPQVLAFCSAQARDGGTGALYVLIKQNR